MLLVLPVKDDYHVAIYGVSALLAGMLMYFVFVYPANKPVIFYRVNEKMVVITQMLLNTVPHRDD
ncbi:Protein AAT-7 [Aphelenchoides avenae]|nr:Protein AAT-7 [Aphelenchus avenae]